MATIGAPFGVRGCFRLKTFTENPKDTLVYGPLYDVLGKMYVFTLVRVENLHTLIVTEKNVQDRTAAEALRGVKLYTDQSILPEINDADAVYYGALVGMDVQDTKGQLVGVVSSVENYGASDILMIKTKEGTQQIAFIKDSVPDVDTKQQKITVVREHLLS